MIKITIFIFDFKGKGCPIHQYTYDDFIQKLPKLNLKIIEKMDYYIKSFMPN